MSEARNLASGVLGCASKLEGPQTVVATVVNCVLKSAKPTPHCRHGVDCGLAV